MQRPTRAWRVTCAVVGALALVCAPGCDRRADATRARLEFWTLSLKPTFTGYIESQLDAFERDRPGVEVVWVDVPFGAVERKLIAAAAAGRAPDVINLSDLMFARFAGAGAFAELSPLLPGDPGGRYHEGALGVGRVGDGVYALPWYLTTQTMILNTGLLARAGLDESTVARDWPGLIEQARPFAEATGERLFTQPLGQDSQLTMMLHAEGLPPFRENADGELVADLTRPEIVAFLRDWAELYRDGALPRQAATNGFEHLIDVYQNERVAVLNTGANFLGRVRGVSQRVYDRTAVLPPITGSLGRAHIAVMPLSVSARTEHPELAAALVWHMTSPEAQLAFCRLAPILPSTPASLDDPFFEGPTEDETAGGLAKIGEARAIVAGSLADAVAFTPALEAWPELRRAFEAGFKRVLLADDPADAPLESTLADIERDWNRILGDMNERRAAQGIPPATMDAIPTPSPVARVSSLAPPAEVAP
ncbi:MAG: ABC transporter substrate-binding protein [Phycisphaerales bacterium JB040]